MGGKINFSQQHITNLQLERHPLTPEIVSKYPQELITLP